MGDFALVTEGVTDHAVLKNVLIGFYKEQREPELTFEHPDPQAAQKFGGWTLVMNYLREKKFRQAFQFNDFVIVQVDTDVAEDPGFDVPKQDANGPLTVAVLVEKVIERLKAEIGDADLATYGERFLFAVGVEQIECWVLPLWFHDAKGEQIANCIPRLGQCPNLRDELDKKKLPWISEQRKEPLSYDEASRDYRKRKSLLQQGPRNPSLGIFLADLMRRNIQLPPLDE